MFSTWLITHLCLYQSVTGWLSARGSCSWESHLAGEVGKASGEQGTGTISKGGTSVVFSLCLGQLLNIRVIAGPAFFTLQWLGVI